MNFTGMEIDIPYKNVPVLEEIVEYIFDLQKEENDELACIEVLNSTSKTSAQSILTTNPSLLKSSNLNKDSTIKDSDALKSTSKSVLPVLSIYRKESLFQENENLSLDRITKTYQNRKKISEGNTISENEELNNSTNKNDTQTSNVSRRLEEPEEPEEVYDLNSTAKEVESGHDVEITEEVGSEQEENDIDELSESHDNYVDVECVSDCEDVLDARGLKEDTLSEVQLAKTAAEVSKDGREADKERRVACPNDCGNFFYMRSALQKHVKYNCSKLYSRQSFRYKCGYCDTRSEYCYSIMRHINKHHRMQKQCVIDTWLKEVVGKREGPKKKASILDDIPANDEDSNKIETVKQHECPNNCGSSFDHVYNISRHIRRTCSMVQRFQCPYCKYRTRTFLLITRHIEVKHRLSKVYAINIFTKQVVYKDTRRRRTNLEKETLKTLKTLKKGTGEENSLNAETGVSKGESSEGRKKKHRFQCPNDCGLSFNFKYTLDKHLRFVCGKMRFKCPYCPKQCRQERGAILHIKHRHSGKKNYVIDILKKKVIYESGGIKHCNDFESIQDEKTRQEFEKSMRDAATVKHKQKQQQPIFKCPLCSKLCKHAWNLSMHMKFRHPHYKNYNFQLIIPPNNKSENQQVEDIQEAEYSEEVEDSFDEVGDFSENASNVGCFDVLEDTKEILTPFLSSLANTELSLDLEAKDTSTNAKSSFKSPSRGRRNFLCPNNCGSFIKYEHNLTRHLRNVCGKDKTLKCPQCQYRCKYRINMIEHVKLHNLQCEAAVIDNDSSKELLNEANKFVVKKEPAEVDPPE